MKCYKEVKWNYCRSFWSRSRVCSQKQCFNVTGKEEGNWWQNQHCEEGRAFAALSSTLFHLLGLPSLSSDRNHCVHKEFWAGWALFRRIIFEICWLSIFKRAQLEVQAYYTEQLIRAMVWNTIALWWHCYGITVNDQNIKELIEVQSSIKVNWFFWQRMQMRSFDIAWIPTTEAWLTLISMVINLWTAGWAVVKGRGE